MIPVRPRSPSYARYECQVGQRLSFLGTGFFVAGFFVAGFFGSGFRGVGFPGTCFLDGSLPRIRLVYRDGGITVKLFVSILCPLLGNDWRFGGKEIGVGNPWAGSKSHFPSTGNAGGDG